MHVNEITTSPLCLIHFSEYPGMDTEISRFLIYAASKWIVKTLLTVY